MQVKGANVAYANNLQAGTTAETATAARLAPLID
jgi:hypothetical protein